MKFAYLHKNFQELRTEYKTICVTNGFTLLLCLFPWYTEYPVYGDGLWKNAFGGPSFLIGSLIFLLALTIVLYFVDQLFEPPKINLPFSENLLFFILSAQQIILILLTWSVLQYSADKAYNAEVRFGVFLSFLMQFIALVASILSFQRQKKQNVRDFFQQPEPSQSKTLKQYPKESPIKEKKGKPSAKKESHHYHNLLGDEDV